MPRGTTVTRDVSLENTGAAELNLLDVRFGPGAPSAFSLSPAAPRVATLAPGQSLLFHVSYSPSASASSSSPATTTLVVDTDESGIETQSIPVSGSAGLPNVVVTGSLDFGTVPRGTTAVRTVGVQNLGQGDLKISNITISGDSAYSISPASPTSGTLPPGGFLTVDVRFSPPASASTAGPRTATLTVASDDPSNPVATVPATGLVGVPKAVVQPASLDFGTVCPGVAADRDLTVTNTGSAPLTITAITLTAGSSSYLSVLPVPSLPQTLPVGGHLSFTVRLNVPGGSAGGPIAGSVDVTTDDPVTPTVNVPITGTIGSGALTLSTTQLAFNGVPVDDRTSPSTKDKTLTLSNTGNCAVTITSAGLTIGGANPGDFSLVGAPSLPLTLAPGSSVQIVVRFNPSAAGNRSATLTITPAAPLTASVVSLTGTGLIPAILTNPSTLVYPPTVIASQAPGYPGVTLNNVITNTGQAELIVDVLSTTGAPFAAPGPAAPPSRFAASDHFSEPVTFAPTATGKFVGTLTVSDTGPDVGPVTATVPLCGEGVKRGIRVLAVSANGVPFSSVSRLKLQSHGTAQNVNINAANLPLVPVPTSCAAGQQRQFENQALPATDTLNQRSSYYTLAVTAGGKSTTLTFTLGVAEFKTILVTIK